MTKFTEEDTFNRLRRPSYNDFKRMLREEYEVFKLDYPNSDLGKHWQPWVRHREAFAKKHGWTFDEYRVILDDETERNNATF